MTEPAGNSEKSSTSFACFFAALFPAAAACFAAAPDSTAPAPFDLPTTAGLAFDALVAFAFDALAACVGRAAFVFTAAALELPRAAAFFEGAAFTLTAPPFFEGGGAAFFFEAAGFDFFAAGRAFDGAAVFGLSLVAGMVVMIPPRIIL